jgi:transcriptional antiterminator RfaH
VDESLPNRKWYAVHIKSNQERVTADFLRNRNVVCFLPTYSLRSKRKDREKTLARPLFTGYLFVYVDYRLSERVEVLKAPGTVRIVSFSDKPAPIPDDTIESIRILVETPDNQARPHPLLQAGRRVKVVDGPFAGASGKLQETRESRPKLVVEIEFLGRAVAVPIRPEQVQPLFDT